MVCGVLLFLLWLPLASPAQPVSRMTMKDGRVYLLKEPPQLSGSRIVFTTLDGHVFSMDEKEVASITALKPTPIPTKFYNPQDSQALGAIARQQRERRGKLAEVAPRPTRRPTQEPKPTRTPRPRTIRPTSRPNAVTPH